MSEVVSEEDHPCHWKAGTVCKIDEQGDIYCATPNACGEVHEELGFTRMLNTILTVRTTYRREGDKLAIVRRETRRIPLDRWDSLRYVSCCVEGAGVSEAGYPLYRWLTNVPELNTLVEVRKRD